MDGWNTIVSFWYGLFSGAMLVLGSVSPENWWLEDENSFWNGPSSGNILIFFWGGNVKWMLEKNIWYSFFERIVFEKNKDMGVTAMSPWRPFGSHLSQNATKKDEKNRA